MGFSRAGGVDSGLSRTRSGNFWTVARLVAEKSKARPSVGLLLARPFVVTSVWAGPSPELAPDWCVEDCVFAVLT